MCIPALLTAMGVGGAAAATGAVATALSLQTHGIIVSIGGALVQGITGMQAAKAQSAAIESQKQTEAQLNAVEDQRQRAKFTSEIRKQNAELAARGIQLDSVTAIALGQTAAQEMSFDSQSIRATGVARQRELTAEQRAAKSRGLSSMLKGSFNAAGTLLSAAPDLWPGFAK